MYESGGDLTATCSITNQTGGPCRFTTPDIFFRYLNEEVNSSYVSVGDGAARLTMPGLRRDRSGRYLYCKLRGYFMEMSNGKRLPVTVDNKVIRIDGTSKVLKSVRYANMYLLANHRVMGFCFWYCIPGYFFVLKEMSNFRGHGLIIYVKSTAEAITLISMIKVYSTM